jgi:hypothetical protein
MVFLALPVAEVERCDLKDLDEANERELVAIGAFRQRAQIESELGRGVARSEPLGRVPGGRSRASLVQGFRQISDKTFGAFFTQLIESIAENQTAPKRTRKKSP